MQTLSRDSLCNIGAVQIPRPKCNGFQFVPTRGRMGFYRSIKRDGSKYGIEIKNDRGPRRPQLPDAGFWKAPSQESTIYETNNNIEKGPASLSDHSSYSDLSSSDSGSTTKFPIAPLKKSPPPAPPLPHDAARLPPRPPRIGGSPKKQMTVQIGKTEIIEPPVDYSLDEEDEKPSFKRQAPVMSKVYRQSPTEYEVSSRKYSHSSSGSSGSKYSERF